MQKKIVSKIDWVVFIIGLFVIFIDVLIFNENRTLSWDSYFWFIVGLLLVGIESVKIIREFKLVSNKRSYIVGILIFGFIIFFWVYAKFGAGYSIGALPIIIIMLYLNKRIDAK